MNVNIAPDFAGLWDALDADTLAILEENNLADPKHERLPAVPVWTNGPKPNIILDCHHTHSIRKRHRLTIRYSKLEFPDRDAAMDYARRTQLGRRNLTESQMALAVAEWKKNRRKQGQPAENRLNSTISLDGMAKVAGVGRSTMIAATKVADKSPPQIVKAVAAGEVKVSDAVAVLELSPKEQLAALTKKRKGQAKTLKQAAAEAVEANGQPESIEDAVGCEVPKQLLEVFAAVEEFATQHKALAAIKKWAGVMAETKAGSYLHLQSFMATLTEAQKQLKFERPHAVCPYCLASKKSCDACKGRGFVKRAIYDSAPSELRV